MSGCRRKREEPGQSARSLTARARMCAASLRAVTGRSELGVDIVVVEFESLDAKTVGGGVVGDSRAIGSDLRFGSGFRDWLREAEDRRFIDVPRLHAGRHVGKELRVAQIDI